MLADCGCGDDGHGPDPGLESGLLTHPAGRGGIGGGVSSLIVVFGGSDEHGYSAAKSLVEAGKDHEVFCQC